MKRRVRIYKAQEGGQGQYVSPLSNFMAKAQAGMEQQADPQQIIVQVANLVAPPPYGEGQDPNQIYQTLAQSYGEETASQIINAAAAYVQQLVGEEQSQSAQQEQTPQYNDLSYQEQLINDFQDQQEEAYNNAAVEEDEAAFDEMLLSTSPALEDDEEMRLGGAKKQFVKHAVKLAKKALGDAGTQNSNTANSTDILNGREKQTGDFLSTIQNQATLATIQKQAENMANSMFKPTPQFQQEGGFTGQDIFKFVYGGNDSQEQMQFGGRKSRWNSALYNEAMDYNQESNPYYITDINAKRGLFGRLKNYNMSFAPRPEEQGIPYSGYGYGSAPDAAPIQKSVPMFTGSNMTAPRSRVPKAQAGLQQISSLTNDLNTNKRGITSFMQGVNLDNATSNKELYNYLKSQGVNVGDYREGIDYSKVDLDKFSSQYNNFNIDPYRTGTMWDVLLPNNGIFNKTYTVNGTNMGALNPRDLMKQGFNMDKQRLGLGHKLYTFTPIGSEKVTADNKDQEEWTRRQDRQATRDALGKNYKLNQFFQNTMSSKENDRSPKLRNWIDQKRSNRLGVPFPEIKAYGGIPQYQGNTSGSSVNTQVPDTDFYPRTDWQKPIAGFNNPSKQFSIPQSIGVTEEDMAKYQDPSLTVEEKTQLNGQNFLNIFNPAAKAVAKGIETFGQRDNTRNFYENLDSTNQAAAVDTQFRGNYDPNSGLFRQDQMGQLWQSAEGGQRRKTGQQSDWGLGIFPTAMGGSDINQYMGTPKKEVQDSLSAVPRDEANLEAEGGETAFGDINGDGFPEHMKIIGPRHSSGGVPLNLPDDTFIFSDTRSMKISDPKILKMFNKPPKKGGYTPAELAKPYDINKYRTILADPDTDVIARKTAELMIKNYNIKLGALALAQESKKGFPQGIPVVAQPYMEMMGLKEEDLIPEKGSQQHGGYNPSPEEVDMMQQVDETGMPPVDQMAMGQEDMSGEPMEEAPMAAYGMSVGGYGMPFAQDGMVVDPYQGYINAEPTSTGMSERDARISQKPYYHFEPQTITNPNPDHYWLTAGDRLRNLRSFITGQEPGTSGVSYQFQDGGVQYDVKDKGLRPDVETKGYTFVDPADEFIYEQENVGPQTKQTGYTVDPESGFYYSPSAGKKPGKAGLEDFYRRHKDFIDLYSGKYGKGKDAWMKEIVEAKGKVNPAMTFVVDNLNALHRQLTGKDMVDISKKGAYIPGVELFNLPGLQRKPKEKELPKKEEAKEEKEKTQAETQIEEDDDTPLKRITDAPWWLQDQIKIAGAFGDLMSLNKYYPWAPKYNPYVPEPVYLDPTRAIAANAEQAQILGNTMAQFSPSAPLAAGRLSGLQGQLAKNATDIAHQYDTANVQIANQYGPAIADIYNKAQLYNQGVSKQLYDANTILNQQYDNSKRALRNNLLNQYTNAITNRWKTDALNQMYPQFAVDPSVGGRMYYTGTEKDFRPEDTKTLADLYKDYYELTGDREAAQKFAMLQYKENQSGSGKDLYPAEAMMSLYGNMKDGGGVFVLGPNLLPPMIL